MKVSIIIPCKNRSYNTQLILNELCRQKQQFPQTEIIVIENGSTEDMSFLENYDIICEHGTKTGVSHARNVGLATATGDYICFIDNDDTIFSNYLSVVYQNIESGYDWYAWQWYSDDTPVLMTEFDVKNPLKSNWALWGYCFKKSLFDGIQFDENKKAGEDLIIFDIITEETRGYFIKELMYKFKWKDNEESLSHLWNCGKI